MASAMASGTNHHKRSIYVGCNGFCYQKR